MQQFTLSLDDPQDITSRLELKPEREQRLIALMAEAARRQLTWLRSDPTAIRVDCHAPDAADRVAACVESFVARAGAGD